MIKVPYAERDGQLIHISRVERGLACRCVCPVCKTAVIARKGKKLRHHFSHHSIGNCTAETVLHYIAKILVFEKIGALFLKTVFVVDDHCWRCGSSMNLAFMEVGDVLHGPEIFSQNEQVVARKSGVLLKIFFDHQENKRFLANVCPACGISTGSAYLRSFKRLERKLRGEPTGLLCGKCGKHFT
ncbi:MAG: hypothetical protein PHW79_02900 [Candidatus Marinimicrobia bacterium]|nr:hypothetical protein [Candidatus Neomarinimicrobiota bacterium]